MSTNRRVALLWRRAFRSFRDKPNASSTNLPKAQTELKAESAQKKGKTEEVSDVEDHINPITGEIGGPRGPEPTRYGDWERKGRVSDF